MKGEDELAAAAVDRLRRLNALDSKAPKAPKALKPRKPDVCRLAQEAAEERLVDLDFQLSREEEGLPTRWPDDMQAPFCGCQTCIVREVLTAIIPFLPELAAEFPP